MRKVFLITGFQNWGKTFLIHTMFENRVRYYLNSVYPYSGHDFCVQSQSNDDLGQEYFESRMEERFAALKDNGIKPTHICAAFCPTKEPENRSDDIIKNLFSKDEVHIIAIEHKWCLHAKLNIQNIKDYYADLKNVTVHVLSEKDKTKKKSALDALILPLL